MAKVSILGAGSWGTALAMQLCRNAHEVVLWSHREEEAKRLDLEREHVTKLPGVKLPDELIVTSDLEYAMSNKDIVVLAVPSIATRKTAERIAPLTRYGQLIVTVSKGIEEQTLMTQSEIVEDVLPHAEVVVLSGPSHAEEVSRGLPTTCVAGAKSKNAAQYVQNIFMTPEFRVYISADVLGIELGAALKNVIALAAGTADGLGYGDNTKAALITRGMKEIALLGHSMGAKIETFYGLSGIGDLIVTCASVHSRNRKAGYLIGQGYTMEDAMKEVKMVVEGVYSAKSALALAEKYHVEMPIIAQVNSVLFDGKGAAEAVQELMVRDKKIESPELEW